MSTVAANETRKFLDQWKEELKQKPAATPGKWTQQLATTGVSSYSTDVRSCGVPEDIQ